MFELHQGDCLEVMKQIPNASVDMVLCDLPYGTTACTWDSIIPLDLLWEQYKRLVKESSSTVLTASQPFTSKLVASNFNDFKHEWIWVKNRGSNFASLKYQPMKEHESVLIFCNSKKIKYTPIKEERKGNGASRVKYSFNGSNTEKREVISGFKDNRVNHREEELRFPSSVQKFNTQVGLHPTQKPVALLEYLIKTYTNPNDVVLDNTMGSGSTGVACANTGRRFIGIERDEKYFQIAKKRVEEAYANSLF